MEKKNRVAIIIAGMKKSKHEGESRDEELSEGDPEMETYAEDLISAVKSSDAEGVCSAIRCLFDAMKHEGDEDEEV